MFNPSESYPMPRFPYAEYARLLTDQRQRDRFARRAHRQDPEDAARLYRHVSRSLQTQAARRV